MTQSHRIFLFKFMQFMDFGFNWMLWINGFLASSKFFVQVNGCPNEEFSLEHGFRQGDPLSPFLFLLVMESLNITMFDAIKAWIFDII